MIDCVKVQPHLLFLICPQLGLFFCNFWTLRRNYLVGSGSNFFWDLPMQTMIFGFGSTALSFCFQFDKIWGLFCTFLAFRGYLLVLWGYFWVGVWFKNSFGTYLCRQSTFVLEIQLYFSVFDSAKFGAFFGAFRGYFWGKGKGQKLF